MSDPLPDISVLVDEERGANGVGLWWPGGGFTTARPGRRRAGSRPGERANGRSPLLKSDGRGFADPVARLAEELPKRLPNVLADTPRGNLARLDLVVARLHA